MMYGALGRKTSHTTNEPTRSTSEEFLPIARAKNQAATAGIAARKRFHAIKPSARDPVRAKRNTSNAPHQHNSITNSSKRGACPRVRAATRWLKTESCLRFTQLVGSLGPGMF